MTTATDNVTQRTGRHLAPRRAVHLRRVWPTAIAAGGLFAIAALLALTGAGGCAEKGNLLFNADPALRKPVAEFRAEGVTLHPYKADAPRGGQADGGAQVDYTFDTLEVANFSKEDWTDVEIWVNGTHVVRVPRVDKDAGEVKTLNFYMLVDSAGNSFPRDNTSPKNHVRKVEMLRDGKLYDIRVKLAD